MSDNVGEESRGRGEGGILQQHPSKKLPSYSIMLNYSFEPIHAMQEYNEE